MRTNIETLPIHINTISEWYIYSIVFVGILYLKYSPIKNTMLLQILLRF